jgi:hypothetical protein
MWHKKYSCCIICGNIEFPQKYKGLCSMCYPLIKKKEYVNSWNPANILVKSPFYQQYFESIIKSNDFENARNSILTQIDYRIYLYKLLAQSIKVEPIKIEYLLSNICSLVGNTSKCLQNFHGITANYEQFEQLQLRLLAKDLATILCSKPFKIDIWKHTYDKVK